MRKKEEFLGGASYRIMNLPSGILWMSPRGKPDLKNGDIITLRKHEPVKDRDKVIFGDPNNQFSTSYYFVLSYDITIAGLAGVAAVEWVEDAVSPSSNCTCSISTLMISGCTCGVFKKETESGREN